MENEMSIINRIINIFLSPKEAFESIDRKPDWIAPLIILIVFSMMSVVLIWPYIKEAKINEQEATIERMKEQRNLSDSDLETMRDRMDSPILKYVVYGLAPISPILMMLFLAGLFHFSSIPFGGEGTYGKAFAMICYSWMISLLWSIIFVLLALTQHRIDITASLNFLVSDSDSILYHLLTKLDLFRIWQLVVIAIGLSVIEKIDTKKSSTVVFGWWIIWIIISVGFTVLMKRMGLA